MYFLLHLELKFRVIQTRSNSLDLRVGIGAKGRETTVKHHFQYLSQKLGGLFGIVLANMEGASASGGGVQLR